MSTQAKPDLDLNEADLIECRKRVARSLKRPFDQRCVLTGKRDDSDAMRRMATTIMREKINAYLEQDDASKT